MDFFEQTGTFAIGSRLRLLTEKITEDASKIFLLYGVTMQPKWFPVYYVLSRGVSKTITSIAQEIGHSHPSVSKIIREMARAGYVVEKKDKKDGRKNLVHLSARGKRINERIQNQYRDVASAIDEILCETKHNLWKAIAEWELMLEHKTLFTRVTEHKKKREEAEITIVDFLPSHTGAFHHLNEEWITTYFKMEAADRKALGNPQGSIMDKGGRILVALHKNEVVGVCALIKMHDEAYDFELAKMAISPLMRGKGIGWMLGIAIIKLARSLGGKKLYLESNTILKPAISLYRKLGFKEVFGRPSPYERCNIQMELIL
jgi:DNA-binding MarR family transcriptional regulator/GNAT superfamily N-acetyltransferase